MTLYTPVHNEVELNINNSFPASRTAPNKYELSGYRRRDIISTSLWFPFPTLLFPIEEKMRFLCESSGAQLDEYIINNSPLIKMFPPNVETYNIIQIIYSYIMTNPLVNKKDCNIDLTNIDDDDELTTGERNWCRQFEPICEEIVLLCEKHNFTPFPKSDNSKCITCHKITNALILLTILTYPVCSLIFNDYMCSRGIVLFNVFFISFSIYVIIDGYILYSYLTLLCLQENKTQWINKLLPKTMVFFKFNHKICHVDLKWKLWNIKKSNYLLYCQKRFNIFDKSLIENQSECVQIDRYVCCKHIHITHF